MNSYSNNQSNVEDVVNEQVVLQIRNFLQFSYNILSDCWYSVLVAFCVLYSSLKFDLIEATIDVLILKVPLYICEIIYSCTTNNLLGIELQDSHIPPQITGILRGTRIDPQLSKPHLRFKKTLYEDLRDHRDPSESPRFINEEDRQVFNSTVNTIYYVEKSMYHDDLPCNINLKTFIGEVISPHKSRIIQDLTWPLIGLFESVHTTDYGTIFQHYFKNIEQIELFDEKTSSLIVALIISLRGINNEKDAKEAIGYVFPLTQQFYECLDSTLTILEDLRAGGENLLRTIHDLLNLFGVDFRDFRDTELALHFCELYLSIPPQDDANTRLVLACEKFDPGSVPHTISAFSSYRNVEKGIMQILAEIKEIPSFLEETLWDCEKLTHTIQKEHDLSNIMKAHECASVLGSMQTYKDLIESLEFYASSIEEYYLVLYEFLRVNRRYIKIAELSDISKLSSSLGSCLLNSNDQQPNIDVASTAHAFRTPIY